jgi:hypothetical protein
VLQFLNEHENKRERLMNYITILKVDAVVISNNNSIVGERVDGASHD